MMATFSYRAATNLGLTLRGTEDASSASDVERTLTDRGLFPLEVVPAAERGGRRRGLRTRRADVVEACRYLATLLEAGFPLDRALGTVARVAARDDVAEAVLTVRARVRAGARLGDALAEHPELFPRVAVGMATAGERGGHLAGALSRLAGQLEREHALRSRLVSASLYPIALLLVGATAVAVLLVHVLPRLVAILTEAGAAVPPSTAALLSVAEWLSAGWPLLLGAAAVSGAALPLLRRSAAAALAVDRLLLSVPIIGQLRQRLAAARFGYSFGTLLASGFPVLPALEITADSMTDRAAALEIRRAREEVRAGGRLARALGGGCAFPFVFLQMIEVGEDAGRLPQLIERGAQAMEQELERGLERLVRLAEPILIVVFGVAIGLLAMSLLQTIYGINADLL
jgi:general secretion pathway protein F